jgi:hypothetical protein
MIVYLSFIEEKNNIILKEIKNNLYWHILYIKKRMLMIKKMQKYHQLKLIIKNKQNLLLVNLKKLRKNHKIIKKLVK